jgi:hypothetical protein
MFGIENSYYNKSLKKLVVAFGSIFNEIYLSRLDPDNTVAEKIRVPLTYGPKEKFVRRLTEASSITEGVKLGITLPVIGFHITNITFDPSRKLNKLKKVSQTTSTSHSVMWSEIPYNVDFGVYVFTRTIDDNFQIVEQILPSFTPDFTVTINFNGLNPKVDVPFQLNTIQTTEDFEGTYATRRSVTSSLTFTAKTYIYGQIREYGYGPIENVDVNFKNYVDETDIVDNFFKDTGYTGNTNTGSITYNP